MTAKRPPATVVAFDFGMRRIGVAVGNTLTCAAHSLVVIAHQRADDRFDAIAALLDEWQPGLLVVGLPVHADGTPHAMTARAQRFARQLEGRFGIPVELADERWTTQGAQQALAGTGSGGRKARAARDRVAAQIILQAWFDDHDAS